MAGYICNGTELHDQGTKFKVGTNLRQVVVSHTVTLQVNEDELDAVLWGIQNYQKAVNK